MSDTPSYSPFRRRKNSRLTRLWKTLVFLFEQPREELSHVQRLLVDFLRFLYRTPRRMAYNRWLFHAAALAYQTLLGLVPAIAITMAVLSHSAFDASRTQFMDRLVDVIYPLQSSSALLEEASDRATLRRLNLQGKQLVRDSIQKFAHNAGKVGGFGFVGLLLVIVLLFRSVETSFNVLWEVRRNRPWAKHVPRTLLCLLLAPVAVYLSFLGKDLFDWIPILQPGSGRLASFVWTTAYPYLCFLIGLMVMYRFIPNTKVRPRPAWGAAILAAFALEAFRHLFSFYAVKVLTVSKVYGALAVVPLVMVWLYFSWAVVLFGAEAAHVLQTIDVPEEPRPHR
jgi:membrane protein